MDISVEEVSLRCMGCSELLSLEDAVKQNWLMCRHCGTGICARCLRDLDAQKHCLSFACSSHRRIIDLMPIPVQKILAFAEEHYQETYKQGILYKLFYEEAEQRHTPAFFVVKTKTNSQPDQDQPSTIREEIWKNFQLVITKRRGGQFITWEKVGETSNLSPNIPPH